MPSEVIDRVHALARRYPRGLEFGDRNGNAIVDDFADEDDSDDESYHPESDDDDDDDSDDNFTDDNDDDAASNASDDTDDDGDDGDAPPAARLADDNDDPPLADDTVDVYDGTIGAGTVDDTDDDDDNDDDIHDHADGDDESHPEPPDDAGAPTAGVEHADADDAEDHEATAELTGPPPEQMDELYGERTGRHNLRPRKARNYDHLHVMSSDVEHPMNHMVFSQYNVNKGIKLFGQDGIDAVLKEVKQLDDRDVLEPTHPDDLSPKQKHDALSYLMFLKQKRNGTIKGRGCADGRKQRSYITKEESSSPTVSIEALMLSLIIDAREGRDVATADVPGAFMQADMEGDVYMRIDGVMAELLIKLNPDKYEKCAVMEKGKTVLYCRLKKALYGTIVASMLFWKNLRGCLEEWGFEGNPYDYCVMNKIIGGKQMTVLWHVDDIKFSHVDPNEVTTILNKVDERYGKEVPISITRGNIHDYLGLTFDLTEPGKVKITMPDYIDELLAELPPDMDGEAPTPASAHLFDVNEDAEKLDQTGKVMFHRTVAKLIFLCKRAKPDLQTAVAFLSTRVKSPDKDDYKKLRRLLRYLRATKLLPLVLADDGTGMLRWWIDTSFGVHPDMKSHTGGAFSLGTGAAYGTSTRQKLNTKSSTEAELVGVDDVMPQVIWTKNFLEAQGYEVKDNVIYQDNQSAMLLEKNGRMSSGKRTRHINIRYFFVTDRIVKKEVRVEYCPTGDMNADYLTKPLQGVLFRKFRNWIMGLTEEDVLRYTRSRDQTDPDPSPSPDHRSVLG